MARIFCSRCYLFIYCVLLLVDIIILDNKAILNIGTNQLVWYGKDNETSRRKLHGVYFDYIYNILWIGFGWFRCSTLYIL